MADPVLGVVRAEPEDLALHTFTCKLYLASCFYLSFRVVTFIRTSAWGSIKPHMHSM